MSIPVTFPPSKGWAVLDDKDYYTFQPRCQAGGTDVSMLVQVSPEAGFSGNFRVVLAGDTVFKGQMGADKLLAIKEAAGYDLCIEMRPEEISFRLNGVTSDWFDVEQRY